MLFILYTVPVALSADSMLVRNSVPLLPEQLDIQFVTCESEHEHRVAGCSHYLF